MAYAVPPAGAYAPAPARAGIASTPYGYGSAPNTGISSKSCSGTGVGSVHSMLFAFHGLTAAGSRLISKDHTTLNRNTSIDSPMQYAETDTQIFSGCQDGLYDTTRRGIPMKPSANSGAKVEL